jgi:hypothetical protein
MKYTEFLKKLWGAHWSDEWEQYGSVVEGTTTYPLLAFHSPRREIKKADLIITAGFHGEEQAGPLTILKRGEEIVNYARSKDVAISIYPCINPSGFEDKRRYNRSGERPNNAFLEYEMIPGDWTGELPQGESFRRTRIIGPHAMAKETKILFDRIKNEDPVAILDLHQDSEFEGSKSYFYVFGDTNMYLPLVDAASKVSEIVKNIKVDSNPYSEAEIKPDNNGLIVYHDGSMIDYFWRQGADYVGCVETTCVMPIKAASEVNTIWAKGFVDLIAKRDGDT